MKAPNRSASSIPIPLEGRSLHRALRTEALKSVVGRHITFLNDFSASAQDRLAIAHQLTPTVAANAGLHIVKFSRLDPDLYMLEDTRSGRYDLAATDTYKKRLESWRNFNYPNAALKCPLHVRPLSNGSTTDQEQVALP